MVVQEHIEQAAMVTKVLISTLYELIVPLIITK